MDRPDHRMIIVNADDYGYTPGVSKGIRMAFQHGTLSSTTAMMNTDTIETAVAEARAETPEMPLGVHLVLTYGRPLSAPAEVPSLVDDDGFFHRLSVVSAHPERLDPGEVEREWRRQVERLSRLDVSVDHLDSHHHSSFLHPQLTEAMLSVAERYGVPVRKPPPVPEAHPDVAEVVRGSGLWTPDLFVGDLMKGSSADKFQRIVGALDRDTVAELMVHPALVDDELSRVSSYAAPRADELATLLDTELPGFLRRDRTTLVTFGGCARHARRPA